MAKFNFTAVLDDLFEGYKVDFINEFNESLTVLYFAHANVPYQALKVTCGGQVEKYPILTEDDLKWFLRDGGWNLK